ncbi:uncharacterized protein [Panulirus ornatus]|uniref:uncharacterized protein n=1 Tax=Panulirus ornatus TaxID=150431 RepID=UPI003A886172
MWTVNNYPPFPFWLWPPPSITNQWYVQQPPWGAPTPNMSAKGLFIPMPSLVYPPWTAGSNTSFPPIWQCVPPPPLMNCTNAQSQCKTSAPPHHIHDHHSLFPSLEFTNYCPVEEDYARNAKRVKHSQPETYHGKSQWCQGESPKLNRACTLSQGVSGFPSTPEVDLTSSSCSSYDHTCQVDAATPASGGRQDQQNCRPESVTLPIPHSRPTVVTYPTCVTLPPLVTDPKPVSRPTPKTQPTHMNQTTAITRPVLIAQSTPIILPPPITTQPTLKTRSPSVTQTTSMTEHEPVTWPTTIPITWTRTVAQHKTNTWSKPAMQTDPHSWLMPQPAPKTIPSYISCHTSKWPRNTEHHAPHHTSLSRVRSFTKQTVSENFVTNSSHLGSESDTHSVTSDKNVHEKKLYSDDNTEDGKKLGCNNLPVNSIKEEPQSEPYSRENFSEAVQSVYASSLVVKQEELNDTTPAQGDCRESPQCALPIFSDDDELPKETEIKIESWEAIVKTEEPLSNGEDGGGTLWKPFAQPKIEFEDTSAAEGGPVPPANLPVDFDHGDGLLLDREFLEASMDALVPVCHIHLPLADSTGARERAANPPTTTVATSKTGATANTSATTLATANTSTTTLATSNTSTATLATANTSTTTLATSNTSTATLATANTSTTTPATDNTSTTTLATDSTSTTTLATTDTPTTNQATTRTHNVTASDVTWKGQNKASVSYDDDYVSITDDSIDSAATQIFEDEEEPELMIDILSPANTADDGANDENNVDTDHTNHQKLREGASMTVVDNSRSGQAVTAGLRCASTSKEREAEGGSAEFGSVASYPTMKSPILFNDDTLRYISEEEETKMLKSWSNMLMDGVSDTCPLGHKLDPLSATLNMCTRRITVFCTTCNMTVYMNVK